MTPEEIRQIKPGSELDALVAEKVMGWGLRFKDRSSLDDHYWLEVDTGKLCATRKYFRPSTDISAAWQVVEKMIACSWTPEIKLELGWCAWFHNDEASAYGDINSKTAPEAISKASLLATLDT